MTTLTPYLARYILTFTNNNQTILVDSLTGQFQVLANPFPTESIQVPPSTSPPPTTPQGVCMLASQVVVYSPTTANTYSLKLELISSCCTVDVPMFILK